MQRINWLMPLVLVPTLGAIGCHRKEEPSKTDRAAEVKEPTAKPAGSADAGQNLATLPAPDGWLVASEQDWIPIVNDSGAELRRAQDAMALGDREGTAVHLDDAAVAIDEQANHQRTRVEKERLNGAARRVRELAKGVRGGDAALDPFDATLASAYRDSAAISWLYLDEEDWVPTFERPRKHFEHAFELLKEGDDEAAASEIRRGAGFLRLAATSARADDRELLEAQVARLYELAKRAESHKASASDLREALVKVDTAYASSYLHVAEAAYRAKNRAESGRALHELASRMRTRTHFLGEEVKKAPKALLDQVERVGSALVQGGKVTDREVEDLLGRLRDMLGTKPSDMGHG